MTQPTKNIEKIAQDLILTFEETSGEILWHQNQIALARTLQHLGSVLATTESPIDFLNDLAKELEENFIGK